MMGSKAGLERFKELMVGHVVLELGSHCSFQDLTQEGKVGDRAVIVGVIWVQGRLFDCWYHGGHLKLEGTTPELSEALTMVTTAGQRETGLH